MRGYHCQTKADVTVSVSICDGHTRLENCTTLTLQSFFRQASNSPASFHAPSGVQGATRPTRSSGGVMGTKVLGAVGGVGGGVPGGVCGLGGVGGGLPGGVPGQVVRSIPSWNLIGKVHADLSVARCLNLEAVQK